MDIAPVLIPLSRSPSTSASRVSFIQANFLETWPFEDDSFDFVRIAFIGSATPEHLWQHIFDEATRVLTKKGWLQCIDEVSVFRPPKPFAQVDRKLEENLDAFATTSSAEDGSLDAQTDSESHTVLLVKARAFERALKSSKFPSDDFLYSEVAASDISQSGTIVPRTHAITLSYFYLSRSDGLDMQRNRDSRPCKSRAWDGND